MAIDAVAMNKLLPLRPLDGMPDPSGKRTISLLSIHMYPMLWMMAVSEWLTRGTICSWVRLIVERESAGDVT